jgi:hypothetical protein
MSHDGRAVTEPRKPRRAPARKPLPARFDWVPGWVQAVVAVLTLLLAVATAWGLIDANRNEATNPPATATAPAPSATQVALEPKLIVDVWDEDGSDWILNGDFENVNLGTQAIYLVGRPKDDNSALFAILRADAIALFTFPVNLANGEFLLRRPGDLQGYTWKLLVDSAALGSGDALKDLRENGPEAEGVLAVTDVVPPD